MCFLLSCKFKKKKPKRIPINEFKKKLKPINTNLSKYNSVKKKKILIEQF